jgi:hypothetical protein
MFEEGSYPPVLRVMFEEGSYPLVLRVMFEDYPVLRMFVGL